MTARPELRVVTPSSPNPAILEQKPLVITPAVSLYNRPLKPTRWLVEGLIPHGATFCLNGLGGIWKSWLFTDLGIGVATGGKLMNHFQCNVDPPRNCVLFIQLEETIDDAQRKLVWLSNGLRLKPEQVQDMLFFFTIGQPFRMDNPKRMDQLKAHIDDLHPDLVLWDSARKMMRGNENSSEWADEIGFRLKELQEVHPSAHGLIHHWRKRAGDKDLDQPSERGRGSGALRDALDVWLPAEMNESQGFVTMIHDKNRGGPKLQPFNYRVRISDRDGMAAIDYIGSAGAQAATDCANELVDLIKTGPVLWRNPDIENHFHGTYSEDQIRYAVEAMERTRVVMVQGGRGKTKLVGLRTRLAEQLEAQMIRDSRDGRDDSGTASIPTLTPFKDEA